MGELLSIDRAELENVVQRWNAAPPVLRKGHTLSPTKSRALSLDIQREHLRKILMTQVDKIVEKAAEMLQDPLAQGVTHIFLVGGFCESAVLRDAVAQRFPDIAVVRPPKPGTLFCNAVFVQLCSNHFLRYCFLLTLRWIRHCRSGRCGVTRFAAERQSATRSVRCGHRNVYPVRRATALEVEGSNYASKYRVAFSRRILQMLRRRRWRQSRSQRTGVYSFVDGDRSFAIPPLRPPRCELSVDRTSKNLRR